MVGINKIWIMMITLISFVSVATAFSPSDPNLYYVEGTLSQPATQGQVIFLNLSASTVDLTKTLTNYSDIIYYANSCDPSSDSDIMPVWNQSMKTGNVIMRVKSPYKNLSKICITYGGGKPVTTYNFDSVFQYGEDFTNGSLNTTRWEVFNATGLFKVTISGGIAVLNVKSQTNQNGIAIKDRETSSIVQFNTNTNKTFEVSLFEIANSLPVESIGYGFYGASSNFLIFDQGTISALNYNDGSTTTTTSCSQKFTGYETLILTLYNNSVYGNYGGYSLCGYNKNSTSMNLNRRFYIGSDVNLNSGVEDTIYVDWVGGYNTSYLGHINKSFTSPLIFGSGVIIFNPKNNSIERTTLVNINWTCREASPTFLSNLTINGVLNKTNINVTNLVPHVEQIPFTLGSHNFSVNCYADGNTNDSGVYFFNVSGDVSAYTLKNKSRVVGDSLNFIYQITASDTTLTCNTYLNDTIIDTRDVFKTEKQNIKINISSNNSQRIIVNCAGLESQDFNISFIQPSFSDNKTNIFNDSTANVLDNQYFSYLFNGDLVGYYFSISENQTNITTFLIDAETNKLNYYHSSKFDQFDLIKNTSLFFINENYSTIYFLYKDDSKMLEVLFNDTFMNITTVPVFILFDDQNNPQRNNYRRFGYNFLRSAGIKNESYYLTYVYSNSNYNLTKFEMKNISNLSYINSATGVPYFYMETLAVDDSLTNYLYPELYDCGGSVFGLRVRNITDGSTGEYLTDATNTQCIAKSDYANTTVVFLTDTFVNENTDVDKQIYVIASIPTQNKIHITNINTNKSSTYSLNFNKFIEGDMITNDTFSLVYDTNILNCYYNSTTLQCINQTLSSSNLYSIHGIQDTDDVVDLNGVYRKNKYTIYTNGGLYLQNEKHYTSLKFYCVNEKNNKKRNRLSYEITSDKFKLQSTDNIFGFIGDLSSFGNIRKTEFIKCDNSQQRGYLTEPDKDFEFLTAYGLNTSLGSFYTFNTKNQFNVLVSNITVTALRLDDNNKLVVIEERASDITGTATLFLETNKLYKINLTGAGYIGLIFDFVPLFATSIDTQLSSAINFKATDYDTIWNDTILKVTPETTSTEDISVEVNTTSKEDKLEYTSVVVYKKNDTNQRFDKIEVLNSTNPSGANLKYNITDNGEYRAEVYVKQKNKEVFVTRQLLYRKISNTGLQIAISKIRGGNVISGWSYFLGMIIIGLVIGGYVGTFTRNYQGAVPLIAMWFLTLINPNAEIVCQSASVCITVFHASVVVTILVIAASEYIPE